MVGDIQEQQFSLLINGEIRQQGNSVDMMFPVGQIIAYLSTIYGLQAGDVIYTGTPAGVGPLQAGDIVRLDWHGHIQAEFHVV
ncbi:fumarylacetoacetate hydrolase family protein [Snodgrassella sp. CFCC 13594]|uniref:fumarylacetoacetate hydrolase family protein n=1 Tax=Snodgrassella sp. CFCC 13594 TaxID=1775559 RepID=UPI00350F2318